MVSNNTPLILILPTNPLQIYFTHNDGIKISHQWSNNLNQNTVFHMKIIMYVRAFHTLRPRQNGRHFVHDIFKCIAPNEPFWILHKILGSNQIYSSIGSDNGLASIRRQAIIWTKISLLYWRMYAPLGLNELICLLTICFHTHIFTMIQMVLISENADTTCFYG